MKSKMPWPPAFMPVIKFDQATGLWGGMLVVNSLKDPCSARRAKFGIFPSCINFLRSCGSMPSMPSTMSFFPPFRSGRRPWQEVSSTSPRQDSEAIISQTSFRRTSFFRPELPSRRQLPQTCAHFPEPGGRDPEYCAEYPRIQAEFNSGARG